MVLLALPPADYLLIERDRGQFVPSRRRRMMANVRAERLLKIPADPSPELRIPGAAAQTRMVSVAKIRLDRRKSTRLFKGIFCVDISEIAVGTLITERPPHRSVRAQFGHTACMGLSLSRVHHAIFVVLCCFILLFDPRREHSSIPTAHCGRRRAQRRSRTALLQRRRRLVLDGREHSGRLPVIGWSAA